MLFRYELLVSGVALGSGLAIAIWLGLQLQDEFLHSHDDLAQALRRAVEMFVR